MSRLLHITRADRPFKHNTTEEVDQIGKTIVRRLQALATDDDSLAHDATTAAAGRPTGRNAAMIEGDALADLVMTARNPAFDAVATDVGGRARVPSDGARSMASGHSAGSGESGDSYFNQSLHFGTRIGGDRAAAVRLMADDSTLRASRSAPPDARQNSVNPGAVPVTTATGAASRSTLSSDGDSYFDGTVHFGTRIGGDRAGVQVDTATRMARTADAELAGRDIGPAPLRELAVNAVASRTTLSSDEGSYFDGTLHFGTRLGERGRLSEPVSKIKTDVKAPTPVRPGRERVFSAGESHRELNPYLAIDTQLANLFPQLPPPHSGPASTATFSTPASSMEGLRLESSFKRLDTIGEPVSATTASMSSHLAVPSEAGSVTKAQPDKTAAAAQQKGKGKVMIDSFRLYDRWLADLDFFYDYLRPCCDGKGDGGDDDDGMHTAGDRPNKSHEDTVCTGVFLKEPAAAGAPKGKAKAKHECLILTEADNDRIEHNMLPTLLAMRDWWEAFDTLAGLPYDAKACRQLARKAKGFLAVVEHSRPGLDVCHRIKLRLATRKIKAYAQAAVLRDCLAKLPVVDIEAVAAVGV